jgi:hypothetical protein
MSGVARSQRLLAYRSTATQNSPAFFCPQGYITLVKDANFYNGAAGATLIQLTLSTGDNTVQIHLLEATLASTATAHWQGFATLNPGDYVFAYMGGALATVWLSGAILVGPPQFVPGERAIPRIVPALPEVLPLPAGPSPPGRLP